MATEKRRRQSRKTKMIQLNIRISEVQLELIDQTAREEYTTRSELIRRAVWWYIRPQDRASGHREEDYIFNTLRQRYLLAISKRRTREERPNR